MRPLPCLRVLYLGMSSSLRTTPSRTNLLGLLLDNLFFFQVKVIRLQDSCISLKERSDFKISSIRYKLSKHRRKISQNLAPGGTIDHQCSWKAALLRSKAWKCSLTEEEIETQKN